MVMRVPELQQQFRYQDPRVPAARLQGMQVQTNSAMFGAESGRQMEKAGYLVQRAADQTAHLVDDYNTTQAREGASQFQQDFLAWQTEAAKKVGKDGISTGQDYDTWAQQRMGELTKGMSEVQRGRFQSLVGERMALQKRWAEGYGQEQDGVYKMSTWKTEMSVAGNTIATNPNDPDMVRQALEQIKNSSFNIAKYKGQDDQAGAVLMQEHVAEYMGGTIHNLIQQGQTGAASALMKEHGEQLGGKALGKLNVAMTREREHQAAKARAAEADLHFSTANQAARDLRDGINRGDISVSDAMTQISNIPNPKLQHQTQTNFNQLMRIEEQKVREAEQRGRVDASDAFDKLGSLDARWEALEEAKRLALRADATPQQKAYSHRMQELYKADVEYAETGIKSGSNPAAFDAMTAEVVHGITLEQAKASEHWPKLSTSAKRSFESAINDGTQLDTKVAVQAYDALHMQEVGRIYNKSKDQGDREACLKYVQEKARSTGKGKDAAFIEQAVTEWWMKGSLTNSGFFNARGTYGKLRNEGQFLPDIEDSRRQQILDMFNAHPEVKEAWKKSYGGNLNYAIRGYHLHQQLKQTAPRGAQ